MQFASPQSFLALLLLLPFVYVLVRTASHARRSAEIYGGSAPSPAYFYVRATLIVLFLSSVTAVAARPYVTYGKSGSFLFVVDVSRSMNARFTCSEPTFLDRAKASMRDVVEALPEARFGIFAFDRFAFPITQMTRDRSYIYEVLEHGLYVGLTMQATRTELANALSVVASKKQQFPDIYGGVSHVILLSDGNIDGDYRRRLQEPLRLLREAEIVVLAVGVGNPQETPIVDEVAGRCTGQYIEVDGQQVMIPLRPDVLKTVAAETGGTYFTEAEVGELADALRSELRKFEPEAGERSAQRDLSGIFLVVATLSFAGFLYLPAAPFSRLAG